MADGQGGTWLGLAEAGRRLGVSADALRKQIRRGRCRYEVRRDNAGRWSVLIPDAAETVRADSGPGVPDPSGLLAEKDARIADLQAERDHLRALVARLLEERRPLWAEVRAWMVRRLRGEG